MVVRGLRGLRGLMLGPAAAEGRHARVFDARGWAERAAASDGRDAPRLLQPQRIREIRVILKSPDNFCAIRLPTCQAGN
jgi:hypothetical protein